jgi:hypothetical protein
VADSTSPDPPKTLPIAEEKFSTFLASQGYPKAVCWLEPSDLVVDAKRRFWIRLRPETAMRAEQQYGAGVDRNLGVELRAICATNTETFASVFVPENDLDRQYHLMGRLLKLSCPVEMRLASTVQSPLRWWMLRLLNRKSNVLSFFE